MKKTLLLIVLLISAYSYSQEEAWVYFNDKPNSQYYLVNPLQMLSQRALNRRAIQNIPLESQPDILIFGFQELGIHRLNIHETLNKNLNNYTFINDYSACDTITGFQIKTYIFIKQKYGSMIFKHKLLT
jgi:hypothetical protein